MIQVEIQGEETVNRFLSRASEGIKKNADEVAELIAEMTKAKAQNYAPVRTGRLRRSIYSKQKAFLTYVVGSDIVYAPFVEYGTSRMMAKPYLRPAVLEMQPVFLREMKRKLEDYFESLY